MPAANRTRFPGLAVLIALALVVFGGTFASAQTPEEGDTGLGARLYAENCAVCHGASGEGRVGATLAKDWPSIRPDLTVKSVIERGIPGTLMPAWSQEHGGPLTEEEIEAVVAYILTWQSGGPPVIATVPVTTRPALTPVPNVEGDPNRGAVLYDQNCAVCHGDNLQGRVGATLAKDWPSIRPDLQIQSIIANGIEGSLMPAWSQAKGGPLAEAEIDDLTAFIISHPVTASQAPEVAPAQAQTGPTWITGWGGVLLAVVGFILLASLAIILQTRH